MGRPPGCGRSEAVGEKPRRHEGTSADGRGLKQLLLSVPAGPPASPSDGKGPIWKYNSGPVHRLSADQRCSVSRLALQQLAQAGAPRPSECPGQSMGPLRARV